MTIAESILDLLKRKQYRLKLTAEDIAEMLYDQNHGAYQQLVDKDLLRLWQQKKIDRQGNGGPYHPYTYRLRPIQIDRRGL